MYIHGFIYLLFSKKTKKLCELFEIMMNRSLPEKQRNYDKFSLAHLHMVSLEWNPIRIETDK